MSVHAWHRLFWSVCIQHHTSDLPLRTLTPPPTHFRFHVRRAFYWYDDGLAYNYTLVSLHRKLHNLWGQHFRRAS